MSEPTRNCDTCNRDLPLAKFEGTRKKCKPCRRKIKLAKDKASNETKHCKECDQTKPVHKFRGKVCTSCFNVGQSARQAKRVVDQSDDGRQMAIDQGRCPKKCSTCPKEFNTVDFIFDISKRSWKGTCRSCINKRQTYVAWRASQKELNPNEYAERNRIYAQNHRLRYPEQTQKYNDDRRKNVDTKWNSVVRRATLKNIPLAFGDQEELMGKFGLPCAYCSFYDPDVLNGLDRIDNSLGYTSGNTVPCCPTCNHIKKTQTVEEFFNSMERIVVFNNLDSLPLINKRRVQPVTHFGTGKRLADSLMPKRDEISVAKRQKLMQESQCYLCGASDVSLSIDRVDSKDHYTDDNTRMCCTSCNYMKSDYILGQFFEHVRAIYDHSIRPQTAADQLDESFSENSTLETFADEGLQSTSNLQTIVDERAVQSTATLPPVDEKSARSITIVILKHDGDTSTPVAKYASWRSLGAATKWKNMDKWIKAIRKDNHRWKENYEFIEGMDPESFDACYVNLDDQQAFENIFRNRIIHTAPQRPVRAKKNGVYLEFSLGETTFPTKSSLAKALGVTGVFVGNCLRDGKLCKGYTLSYAETA